MIREDEEEGLGTKKLTSKNIKVRKLS